MDEYLTTPEQREALSNAQREPREDVGRRNRVLERLETIYVEPDSIKPNPWNPNRQSAYEFELLCRSMEEDGFTQPVVCVRLSEEDLEVERIRDGGYEIGDLMIVDGEHRWRGGKVLGYNEIPIVITPMTAAQAMIATLRHNRAHGNEDHDLVAEILRDLSAMGEIDWAQDSLMYDDDELARILDEAEAVIAELPEVERPTPGPYRPPEMVSERNLDDDPGQESREGWKPVERTSPEADPNEDLFRVSVVLEGEDAKAAREVLAGGAPEAIAKLVREQAGIERELAETGWVSIDSILGSRMVPAEAAKVIVEALDLLETRGDITPKNRWQGLEFIAAEFLGS